jgi:hypothetical protein
MIMILLLLKSMNVGTSTAAGRPIAPDGLVVHRFQENEKTTGGPDSVCPWSLILRQRFRFFYASRPVPRADGLKAKPHQKQKSKKLAKYKNISFPGKSDIALY